MKSIIIKDGLSEEEAYNLERCLILYYVFVLGYGIDIIGYRKNGDKYLTNCTFGGDGSFGMRHSIEWRNNHSNQMKGKNNPMYGINLWERYSKEKADLIKQKISKATSGENNPMYGVSPKDRMDHETYKVWYKKASERCKKQIGEKNPNYHNDTLKNKLSEHPELKDIYYPPKYGSDNPNSKKIFVYKDNELINQFNCIGDCCEWLKSELSLSAKISSMRSSISESFKNNKKYHGFNFYYKKNNE